MPQLKQITALHTGFQTYPIQIAIRSSPPRLMIVFCAIGIFLSLVSFSALGENRHDTPNIYVSGEAQAPEPKTTREAWIERLFTNPDNQALWSLELKRVQMLAKSLEKLKGSPQTNSEVLDRAIVNNHQLQGIALRHLKRFDEALRELMKSLEVLRKLENEHKCTTFQNDAICQEIRGLIRLTFAYFRNIYIDLKDKPNVEKYTKLAMGLSSTFEEYQQQLTGLIDFYIASEDFSDALDIIFQVIKDRIVLRTNEEMIEICKIVERIYYHLFISISWFPSTHKLRTHDPRDFMDMRKIGIGRDFKYGMVDPEEDSATFGTVFIFKPLLENFLKSNDRGTDILRELDCKSIDECMKDADIHGYVKEQFLCQGPSLFPTPGVKLIPHFCHKRG